LTKGRIAGGIFYGGKFSVTLECISSR